MSHSNREVKQIKRIKRRISLGSCCLSSPKNVMIRIYLFTSLLASLIVFGLGGVSVKKNKNDTLISSDSLFSEEENETTDNYRQFFPFQPIIPGQNLGQFPGQFGHPGLIPGQFVGQYPQQQYLDPQVQRHQQQQQQQLYVDPAQLNNGQIHASSGSKSKRKKDREGSSSTKRKRKRPQRIEEGTENFSGGLISPDFSEITGYQVELPDKSSGGGSRRKNKRPRPHAVQQEDYDVDSSSSGIWGDPYGHHLFGQEIEEPNKSVKKQLKKKNNNFPSDTGSELLDPNSKTIEEEGDERACPGCVSGDCNANNVISGLPIIQIMAAVSAGAIWAGIFLFLYKNFIGGGDKGDSGGGYGYSPAQSYGPPPAMSYGPPPAMAYGPPPAQSYGPPPAQSYGPPPAQSYGPPPAQSYGVPSSGYSSRISYPTGTGRKMGDDDTSLTDTVWNALDNFPNSFSGNGGNSENSKTVANNVKLKTS